MMRHPADSVPVTVGLDYSSSAVRICVLDAAGGQRLNRDLPSDAAAIVAAVQRHTSAARADLPGGDVPGVRGCAIEACSEPSATFHFWHT